MVECTNKTACKVPQSEVSYMKKALTFLFSSTQSICSMSMSRSPIPDFLNLLRLLLNCSRSSAIFIPISRLFASERKCQMSEPKKIHKILFLNVFNSTPSRSIFQFKSTQYSQEVLQGPLRQSQTDVLNILYLHCRSTFSVFLQASFGLGFELLILAFSSSFQPFVV